MVSLSLSHSIYITQSIEAEERKKERNKDKQKKKNTNTINARNPAPYSDQILYNILLRSVIIHTSHSVFPPSYSMPGLVQRCCHNVLTTFVFSFVFPANCIFSPASHKCVGSKQTKLVNTRQTLVTTPSLAKESTYQEKWLPGLQSKPSQDWYQCAPTQGTAQRHRRHPFSVYPFSKSSQISDIISNPIEKKLEEKK